MSQTKNTTNPFEAWTQAWGQSLNQSWAQPWAQAWGSANTNAAETMREQANRTWQTASAVTQMWAESAQTMARRASEVAQKNWQTAAQCSKDSMSCKSLEEAQKTQANSWGKMHRECCSTAKEMAEITSHLTIESINACDQASQDCFKTWEKTTNCSTSKK